MTIKFIPLPARRRLCNAILVAAGLCLSAGVSAQQEAWPSKPITLVVPFPPGGTSDQMGRLMASELAKALRQPVIVDNRAGANGVIGTTMAIGAPPDGYTLILTGIGSNAINHGLYDKLRYDSNKDFAHITQFIAGPNVLVANAQSPFKTLRDIVTYAKANPGKLNYASSGNGASGHLAMELFKQSAGIDMVHVPYKGGSPALTDVIGGQVPLLFINQDNAYPFVKAGKLRAIAVASLERNPLYPDTPTLNESGFPGFSAVSWVGLSAPKGTPPAIIERLNAELVKALHTPELSRKLNDLGFTVVGSTPAQYAEFVRSETERWRKVIKTANIHLD